MKTVLALLAVLTLPAIADISVPRPKPVEDPKKPAEEAKPRLVISVAVRPDNDAQLIIPRKLLGGAAAKAEKADASILPTVMIGTALTAAITLGGLAIISRRRTTGRVIASIALLGVMVTSATVAIANAPAPRRPDPVSVPVAIQIVEEGDAAQLFVSPDVAANLNRRGR
jgi:hypothetical protein